MGKSNQPYIINSVSEFHKLMGLPGPSHPMVSLIDFKDIGSYEGQEAKKLILNFYTVAIKRDFNGKFKYGQNYYDFDEGVMSFIAPGQLLEENVDHKDPISGWLLVIHPDFLRGYELGKKIRKFGFFSYALNEALYLSEEEENVVENTIKSIEKEYRLSIDLYSQDVMISYLDVLFNYSNRFYNRQFITRKHINNDLLSQLEDLLQNYFEGTAPQNKGVPTVWVNMDEGIIEGTAPQNKGVPTVAFIADQLNISPNYLSDLLKSLTGKTALQHIHLALIVKAKEYLSTTSLTVSEIAFLLGFEHSQSFSKIFKKKTTLSPLGFRNTFNN